MTKNKITKHVFFLKKLVVLENTVSRREVQVSLSAEYLCSGGKDGMSFSCRLGRAKFFQNVFESLTAMFISNAT